MRYLQGTQAGQSGALNPTIEDLLRRSSAAPVDQPAEPSAGEALQAGGTGGKWAFALASIGDALRNYGAIKQGQGGAPQVAPDIIGALRSKEMQKRLVAYRTKRREADSAANEARTRLGIELGAQKDQRDAAQRAAERATEHDYQMTEELAKQDKLQTRADMSAREIADRQSKNDERDAAREIFKMRETHRLSRLAQASDIGISGLKPHAPLEEIDAAIAEKAPKFKPPKEETDKDKEGRKNFTEAIAELPKLSGALRQGMTREEGVAHIQAQLRVLPADMRAEYVQAVNEILGELLQPQAGK
jgi:hypothetical protein